MLIPCHDLPNINFNMSAIQSQVARYEMFRITHPVNPGRAFQNRLRSNGTFKIP